MITTASNPLVIPAPRLGLLNLIGDAARSAEEQDEKAFSPFFARVERSSDRPPECDVLLAYLQLEEDGSVANTTQPLEQIVRRSGAPIVMIAWANSSDAYMKATTWFGSGGMLQGGGVNLVMTMDRRDPQFADFFVKLFEQMKRGVTMPMAWVALAPQAPGAQHNAPETIFACGAGHIAFAERPSFLKRLFGR